MAYNFDQINVQGLVSGYKKRQTEMYQQVESMGAITKIQDGKIFHTIDTAAGQSGAPLIIEEEGKEIVIGIHKGSIGKDHPQNVAVLFTQTIIANIYQWQC